MGINNPVPRSLGKESRKAAKILASFIKPNQVFGADSVIPAEVLQNAQGLAVLTVLKAGFLFSGRAGSGVLVARLDDGSWSGPTGIMTAGMGVGGQIGGELTDFVFILNTRSAVQTFAQAGSITLGGNVSLAAGPLGRNAEAAGSASLKSVAAVFSYAKTKGLFAGISLEGSVLVERRDANREFYGQGCNAKQILSGRVEPPPACDQLFRVLESRAFQGRRFNDDYDDFYDDIPDEFSESDASSTFSRQRQQQQQRDRHYNDGYDDDYEDTGYVRGNSRPIGGQRSTNGASWEDDIYDRPAGRSRRGTAGSRSSARRRRDSDFDDTDEITRHLQRTHFQSTYSDNPGRPAGPKPQYSDERLGSSRGGGSGSGSGSGSRRARGYEDDYDEDYDQGRYRRAAPAPPRPAASTKADKAVALYTFEGEQDGDLSFKKGDVVTIVKKSESTDDWWTGKMGTSEGIFPANYVELV